MRGLTAQSLEERTRAARFHSYRDREYFTATRALLRTILASHLGSDPASLLFRYSEKEKPALQTSEPGDPIEFNVSDAGDAAMLAFSRGRPLGVDVEQVRDTFDHKDSSAAGRGKKRTSKRRALAYRFLSVSLTSL